MKPKSFEIEAFTISYAAKKLGYKSTKTIYRLLKRDLLEDYIYLEKSVRFSSIYWAIFSAIGFGWCL